MKNLIKVLVAIIGFALMISPATTAMATHFEMSPTIAALVITGVAIGVTYYTKPAQFKVFTSGVEVEVWVNYIIERFWKDNAFLKKVWNDDQFVLAGKVVHIPQIGAKPTVVKNRSSYPATAVQRTDTDVTYALDVYTTDPSHIPNADTIELSYNKIDSIFGDHTAALGETIADDVIIKWLTGIAAGSKQLTTGGATLGTAPSATGNRKLFTTTDLRKAQLKMNVDGVSKQGRMALCSANMLDQLTSSLSETQYRDFSQYYNATEGVLGKLYGFEILDRSSVAVVTNANVVKALDAAGAATDNEVSVLVQKDCVARAIGDVEFFENIKDALYYGDVYSALMRAGARRRRSDDKGIIMMVQDASA